MGSLGEMTAHLHYQALDRPPVAQALQHRAYRVLGPLQRFLQATIKALRQRQEQALVAWRVLPSRHRLRLEAIDTLIELPSPPVRHEVQRASPTPPDASQPVMVVSRGTSLPVRGVEPSGASWVVLLDEEVAATETVFWCGQPCSLRPLPATEATLVDGTGGTRRILRAEPLAGTMRLVIEGQLSADTVTWAGSTAQAKRKDPHELCSSLRDAAGVDFPWSGGQFQEVERLPAQGELLADCGVRFRWVEETSGRARRKGKWIELLTVEGLDTDATEDPRRLFCDGELDLVSVQGVRGQEGKIKVHSVDRDQFQLCLDRLPPEGSKLELPLDVQQLRKQRSAVLQLRDAPLPHHRPLLRLVESTSHPWPPAPPTSVSVWYVLTDLSRSGTSEQRSFVEKALGTPDFAFLDGPPGSGKTTTICELILQLVARGKRVLLCSTTHVAVDNVLQRLVQGFAQVEAVRIGKTDRVDEAVLFCQLDERVEKLLSAWRALPTMAAHGEQEVRQMATETVLSSANLTCGTTTGILRHPWLDSVEDTPGLVAASAPFDVLILDEASKTTFHEFLPPALLARRWVIVGDPRQLPPFSDRGQLEAALQCFPLENATFSPHHRRACLLLHRLLHGFDLFNRKGQTPLRWLVLEPAPVLDALVAECAAQKLGDIEVLRVVDGQSRVVAPGVREVSVLDIQRGAPEALALLAAHWVLVEEALRDRVGDLLPGDLASMGGEDRTAAAAAHREWWLARHGVLRRPVRLRHGEVSHHRDMERAESKTLKELRWERELVWRLLRAHELRFARDQKERERLLDQVAELLPSTGPCDEVDGILHVLEDMALPSLLESIQEGTGVEDQGDAWFTRGLAGGDPRAWGERSQMLTYQHRMHEHLSSFPRTHFYDSKALLDATTIQGRDAACGWTFQQHLPGRRLWVDVRGREEGGVNRAEVEEVRRWIGLFVEQARVSPRRDGRPWEVACLTFYVKQEQAIREVLGKLSGRQGHGSRFSLPGVEVVCCTVDRFQGREADLVLLSLRNHGRTGFLDSPNRLNVALTRARFLQVVLGNHGFFARCNLAELEALAKASIVLPAEGKCS